MAFLQKVKGYDRFSSLRNVGIRDEQEVNSVPDDVWTETISTRGGRQIGCISHTATRYKHVK